MPALALMLRLTGRKPIADRSGPAPTHPAPSQQTVPGDIRRRRGKGGSAPAGLALSLCPRQADWGL